MLVGAVIAVVAAVVGFSIIDSIMVNAANLDKSTQNNQNWTSGSKIVSPCDLGIDSVITIVNATGGQALTETTHYTLDKSTCKFTPADTSTKGYLFNVSYYYSDTSTYSSSTSRLIAGYVVPIGLLGVLAMAVLVAL